MPANTLIFRQGELPDYIYFIVEGNIEVVKEITVSSKNRWPNPQKEGGYEEVVRKFVNKFKILDIGPGKYFGELAIVNNTRRAATCQTTVPTVLLALDKFEILNLLHKGHTMANVYSQTQGYPNDEDILHLFSQLKVKKQQTQQIKQSTKGYNGKVGKTLLYSKEKINKGTELSGSSATLSSLNLNKKQKQKSSESGQRSRHRENIFSMPNHKKVEVQELEVIQKEKQRRAAKFLEMKESNGTANLPGIEQMSTPMASKVGILIGSSAASIALRCTIFCDVALTISPKWRLVIFPPPLHRRRQQESSHTTCSNNKNHQKLLEAQRKASLLVRQRQRSSLKIAHEPYDAQYMRRPKRTSSIKGGVDSLKKRLNKK